MNADTAALARGEIAPGEAGRQRHPQSLFNLPEKAGCRFPADAASGIEPHNSWLGVNRRRKGSRIGVQKGPPAAAVTVVGLGRRADAERPG
jgi:hypothetical protein